MTVTLTYSFTQDQFMHAARVLWSYQGISDRGNWILGGLIAVAGMTLLFTGLWTGWIFLGAAALLAAITLLRHAIWRRAFPKMEKYRAPITARFSPDTVHTTSAQGDAKVPWSTFKNYAETPDYFFLFLSRRNFSVIPKTAAKDDLEIETLRELITAKLPRAKMRWT